MANGAPSRKPGALKAITGGRQAEAFDADARRAARETSPVTIEGVSFRRRRKDWGVTRLMRSLSRQQQDALSLVTRLRVRTSELEAEQIEAASKGEDRLEAELETTIRDLMTRADEATEDGEIITYRLLALLLVAPDDVEVPVEVDGERVDAAGAFGPVEDEADAEPAIAFLQPALDVEDAADLARELTGSAEPDPPATPSSETGSS
jgi:hypothetical protein